MTHMMKHTVLERKVRRSLYMALTLVMIAGTLGVISLIVPGALPDSAMEIPAILAIALGYYAVGLKDADSTIYKSLSGEQVKETLETNPNEAK